MLEYLDRFPELRAADSRVLSLVYEEYCLNEECGKAPDVESFCNRYPDWKSSLISQLQYHRLFSQAAGVSAFAAAFSGSGARFRGVPPPIATGGGRDVACLPGQGPFPGGKASCFEGHARPRSRTQGPGATRPSAHRTCQFGRLSDRRQPVRPVHALPPRADPR